MKNSAQNPKLTHIEKLTNALAEKLRYTLEKQTRLANNPETSEGEAVALVKNLTAAYKEAFKGEECFLPEDAVPADVTGWLVTPVVSVRNLMRSSGVVSSVFTYLKEGVPTFAVIWQPMLGVVAHATQGLGASATHEGRLRMNVKKDLKDAVVLLPWSTADGITVMQAAADAGCHTRKTGCAANDILVLATGRADVLTATQQTPAVAAALALFMQEAGGKVATAGDVTVASNLPNFTEAKTLFLK